MSIPDALLRVNPKHDPLLRYEESFDRRCQCSFWTTRMREAALRLAKTLCAQKLLGSLKASCDPRKGRSLCPRAFSDLVPSNPNALKSASVWRKFPRASAIQSKEPAFLVTYEPRSKSAFSLVHRGKSEVSCVRWGILRLPAPKIVHAEQIASLHEGSSVWQEVADASAEVAVVLFTRVWKRPARETRRRKEPSADRKTTLTWQSFLRLHNFRVQLLVD